MVGGLVGIVETRDPWLTVDHIIMTLLSVYS